MRVGGYKDSRKVAAHESRTSHSWQQLAEKQSGFSASEGESPKVPRFRPLASHSGEDVVSIPCVSTRRDTGRDGGLCDVFAELRDSGGSVDRLWILRDPRPSLPTSPGPSPEGPRSSRAITGAGPCSRGLDDEGACDHDNSRTRHAPHPVTSVTEPDSSGRGEQGGTRRSVFDRGTTSLAGKRLERDRPVRASTSLRHRVGRPGLAVRDMLVRRSSLQKPSGFVLRSVRAGSPGDTDPRSLRRPRVLMSAETRLPRRGAQTARGDASECVVESGSGHGSPYHVTGGGRSPGRRETVRTRVLFGGLRARLVASRCWCV